MANPNPNRPGHDFRPARENRTKCDVCGRGVRTPSHGYPSKPIAPKTPPADALPKGVSWNPARQNYRLRVNGKTVAYAKTVAELVPPTPLVRHDPTLTVGQYLDHWASRLRCRPNTAQLHRDNIANYLAPTLGTIRLAALDREMIEDQLPAAVGKRGNPLAPRTIALAHATLRTALARAVLDGYIARNPALGAKVTSSGATGRQRLPGLEMPIPDDAAIRLLIETAADDRWAPLLALSALTGLRQSEALGLTWEDLGNLADHRVQVNRSMVRVTRQLDDPKNKTSRRVVPFAPGLAPILRRHETRQKVERIAAGTDWQRSPNLVFRNERGGPADARSISRWFTRLCRRAGLPDYRWHDLRHAYATGLYRQGVPIGRISQLLGHASETITRAVYAHVMVADLRAEADLAGAIFLPRAAGDR